MKDIKVRLTFTEEVLATSTNDAEAFDEYIASMSPDQASHDEEVAAISTESNGDARMTVFPRDKDGKPFIYNYQIKGFFKDSCSMLSRIGRKAGDDSRKKNPVNESSKLTAHKKVIDGLIFVEPRQIPFVYDGDVGMCQRPLRAQTTQGERVALSVSETVPAGAALELKITMLDPAHEAAVREWLDYGRLRGLAQWRNSGKGTFVWEEIA